MEGGDAGLQTAQDEARALLASEPGLEGLRFGCPRGCSRLSFGELAGLSRLCCPRCGEALGPVRASHNASGSALAHTLRASGSASHVREPGDEPPRRLGDYTLLRELGRGAAGVVYLAQRGELARHFALKVLLHHDNDPTTLGRFELEAQVASRLEHPGIVGVIDVGRQGRFPYYVMEHVAGVTLHERLRDGALAPRAAAELVLDLARSLSFAHGQGVLHRDLKPANVILDERMGRPRITDFGLARDRSLRTSLTHSGDQIGTPLYMSPEQCRGERDLDARTDVWSLGVILYECLTGQRPFQAGAAVQLFVKITNDRPVAPRELDPLIPAALEQVVLGAMTKDRARRTPDADAMAEALAAWLEQDAGASAPATQGRLGLALVAGSLLVGLVSVGVAIGLSRPASSPGSEPSASPTPSASTPTVAASPVAPSPTATPPTARTPSAEEDAELTRLAAATSYPAHRRPPESLRRSYEEIVPRLALLGARFPDDARVRYLRAFQGLLSPAARDLQLRRDLLAAAQGRPPLPEEALGLVTTYFHTLGFQRAAGDLIEPSAANGQTLGAFAGLGLLHVTMKSAPPVLDMRRTVAITRRLIQVRKRDVKGPGEDLLVPTWDLFANLAEALVALGELAPAAQAYRRSAEHRSDPRFQAWVRKQADRADAGALDPSRATRNVMFSYPVTPFTRTLTKLQRTEERSEVKAAEQAIQVANRVVATRQDALAALLLVRAARAMERAGHRDQALLPLQRAIRLRLELGDRDVRALVCRVTAWMLLVQDEPARHAALAERLAREACGPTPAGHPELRTRGERADAWVLAGRAALLQGARARARQAVAEARRLQPFDERGLKTLRSQVR